MPAMPIPPRTAGGTVIYKQRYNNNTTGNTIQPDSRYNLHANADATAAAFPPTRQI